MKPSAIEYDSIVGEIRAIESLPQYRLDIREGSMLRARVIDLSQDAKFHKPAALARAALEIQNERK